MEKFAHLLTLYLEL